MGVMTQTASIEGVELFEMRRFEDARGYFCVHWVADELRLRGLNAEFVQSNIAFNHQQGTLRGLHSQGAPDEEEKLVTCVRGAIYDVVVDIRPDSLTYLKHFGVELSEENGRVLYIPKGCLHGYQTLADQAKVLYQVTAAYAPTSALGAMYDDPAFGIRWPLPVSVISQQDTQWPAFAVL